MKLMGLKCQVSMFQVVCKIRSLLLCFGVSRGI